MTRLGRNYIWNGVCLRARVEKITRLREKSPESLIFDALSLSLPAVKRVKHANGGMV